MHRLLTQGTLACCKLEGIRDLVVEVTHEKCLVVVTVDLLLGVVGQAREELLDPGNMYSAFLTLYSQFLAGVDCSGINQDVGADSPGPESGDSVDDVLP